MKKQEIITEEINRGRKLMGLAPLTFKSNIMEQVSNASTYHEWEDCSGAWMQSGVRYWDRFCIDAAIAEYGLGVAGPTGSSPVSSQGWYMGAPAPYNVATQYPNNGTLQAYATHQNSEAFYIGMGSPSPGTTQKYSSLYGLFNTDPITGVVTSAQVDYCIKYIGPVTQPSTGNHSMTMGTMAMSNFVGPFQDCQMCQMGVLQDSYNCDGQGNCTPVQGQGGTYPDYPTCQAACVMAPSVYRCADCYTPCTEPYINAGVCPYTSTLDCETQCEETDKWRCSSPDKFGNKRCRKCKFFELWDGTPCWPTKQECLDDGDCEQKIADIGVLGLDDLDIGINSVSGCMDPSALNYSTNNTTDCSGVAGGTDTSCCTYTTLTSGCMDSTATNYDSTANADCLGVSNGSDTSCCTYTTNTCDISWNTPCAQTHFGSMTGGIPQLQSWLALRQTGWDSVGCQHLQNVVNWLTDQLNSGVTGAGSPNPGTPLNQTQITRKTAKRLWAQCQATECNCPPLNMPALTPAAPPVVTQADSDMVKGIPIDREKVVNDKIQIKESDITRIVKRLINESKRIN